MVLLGFSCVGDSFPKLSSFIVDHRMFNRTGSTLSSNIFDTLKDKYLLFTKCTIRTANIGDSRYQQRRGLRRRSTAARLLRSWVRTPSGAWKFVCCECCVLSGRGLCDGLIIRSEESYRLWRVAVSDQVTSYARRLKPYRGQ